jgi:hypothetical protein
VDARDGSCRAGEAVLAGCERDRGPFGEGAPGLRGPADYNMYFAYFRDLDGNKIAVSKMGA